MPYVEKGAKIIPVEQVVRGTPLIEILNKLALNKERCKCFIVDTPFIASTEIKGFVVDQAVGVGSIVCSKECDVETGYVVVAPTWGYGRFIGENSECIVAGGLEGVSILEIIGYRVSQVGFEDALNGFASEGRKGIVYLPSFYKSKLEVEEEGPICGGLYSFNPLHPAGVFGKFRPHTACLPKTYRIVGPHGKLLKHVLGVEERPVISVYQGMGEGLIIGFNIEDAPNILINALWLGLLYTCGKES